MDTEYVYEFLVLRKAGGFQKAADILGISQSTLSRHIQAIETEIGKQLILRGNKVFRLTAAGNVFTAYALSITDAQQKLVAELNSGTQSENFLNIGLAHGSGNYGVPSLLNAFREAEAEVSMNTRSRSGDILIHDLQQGLNEIIFVWDPGLSIPGQVAITFAEDVFVLHIPYGHRLYKKDVVHFSELGNEKVYLRGRPYSQPFNLLKQKCHDLGEDINLHRQQGYWMSASDDVLYLTLSRRTDHVRHNGPFHVARIEPEIRHSLQLHYRADGLSAMARKFLNFTEKYTGRSMNLPDDAAPL